MPNRPAAQSEHHNKAWSRGEGKHSRHFSSSLFCLFLRTTSSHFGIPTSVCTVVHVTSCMIPHSHSFWPSERGHSELLVGRVVGINRRVIAGRDEADLKVNAGLSVMSVSHSGLEQTSKTAYTRAGQWHTYMERFHV